ncbi:GNAT family N-acetyltransferase [Nocardioides sp.]|uniref:GNAT family N-acetyltransferase n=1 Tax=Nocardioides sp. TaxID=35761 RepID=UPI00286AFBC3|nr:GNAT family N-acetyltransferase [Nocardioides sp.]
MGRLSLHELHSERLVLVPFADAHRALVVSLNSDPDVMRFIRGRAATPEETLAEWDVRTSAQTDEARGLGYWIGRVDGTFVGWWSASSFADDASRSGLGYRLRRGAWGHGLATEGARLLRDHAFATPGVETVVASTMAVNTASRAVLEKIGLRHTDTWVRQWDEPVDGWEQGDVGYELTRGAWQDLTGT